MDRSLVAKKGWETRRFNSARFLLLRKFAEAKMLEITALEVSDEELSVLLRMMTYPTDPLSYLGIRILKEPT